MLTETPTTTFLDPVTSPESTPPLPAHFLETVVPKIGGKVYDSTIALPQFKDGKKGVRLLSMANLLYQPTVDFPWAEFVVPFAPLTSLDFSETVITQVDQVTISHPSSSQAHTAERIQNLIWGTTDAYPWYLYHPDSPAATKLIARIDGEVIGFLLGFWGQRNGNFWLESQIIAVTPEYRKGGIAKLLKLQQQKEAFQEGVSSIHWTVDPLQRPNAYLNFNTLGAISTKFARSHYNFTNDLNKTPASRLTIEWASNPQVVEKTKDTFSKVVEPTYFRSPAWENPNPLQGDILIEIPADWTMLQKQADNQVLALQIRNRTDRLFSRLIGENSDQFTIGKIIEEEGTFFLVGKPSNQLTP